MSRSGLEKFLVRLAVDEAFVRRWADAQQSAAAGDDKRVAILDEIAELDESDKRLLLDRNTAFGHRIFSSQHTIAGTEAAHVVAPSTASFRITITVESQ